jgi:hypothetical protein
VKLRGLVARGDGGTAIVEFLGVVLLSVLALMSVAQLAVWVWAHDVAATAAHEGARTAAETGRPIEDGSARARELLQDGLAGAGAAFEVEARQEGAEVVVRAQGNAPSLVPFLPRFTITVTGHALDEDSVLP